MSLIIKAESEQMKVSRFTSTTLLVIRHGSVIHAIHFHFSWPVQPGEPVYIVYIDFKLTQ